MADDLHEVVKLLLARMESHPEEFLWETGNRWQSTIDCVREYGTPEEIVALDDGLRVIMLREAHEGMMDELCNGDERRRKEQEDREYERQMMQQAKAAKTVLIAQQQKVPSRHPTSTDMERSGIMNALRNIK